MRLLGVMMGLLALGAVLDCPTSAVARNKIAHKFHAYFMFSPFCPAMMKYQCL